MFKNLLKKVIVCPSCGQRSRVPVKPGKVLRVNCPNCSNIFEIKFDLQTPNFNALNSKSISEYIKSFSTMTKEKKVSYILIAISVIFMLKNCSQTSTPVKQNKMNQSSPTIEEPTIINL